VEVKNMNSFRAVYRAMEYEAKRQRRVAEAGERLIQETRGWVEEKGQTVSQRTKEYAHDYRYFPEPDLPPLALDRKWVAEIKAKLPELPEAKRDRFMAEYGLPLYDASLLTSSKAMADYFEDCLRTNEYQRLPQGKGAKEISNWLLGEASRIMNANNIDITDFRERVSPERLVELTELLVNGSVSGTTAKSVLEEMFQTRPVGASVTFVWKIIAEKGLSQISDTGAIEQAVVQVINSNPQAVSDYRAGKETAIKFLVGQVMKATRGRANPQMVNELLKKKLAGE